MAVKWLDLPNRPILFYREARIAATWWRFDRSSKMSLRPQAYGSFKLNVFDWYRKCIQQTALRPCSALDRDFK